MSTHKIPFQLEAERVISLFASQIYQSPLALLRENAQNAHDAILLRRHQGYDFDACIDIQLEPQKVIVRDNGIGMDEHEVRNNFWRAGSSGKNTPDAVAAGVVGTFGIGAMANFGVADHLTMETERVNAASRIITKVASGSLSLQEDCIDFEARSPLGTPGTSVVASMKPESRIDVSQAQQYIAEFVGLSDIPVFVNGDLVSGRSIFDLVPRPPQAWQAKREQVRLGTALRADVRLIVSQNADIWIHLENLNWNGSHLPGEMVLRSGQASIRTYRSRFGLATIAISSNYQLGGVANAQILQPTAGREALTTDSMQFMQMVVSHIEDMISLELARRPECDASTQFMSWVLGHQRFDLCGNLKMNVVPTGRISLEEVRARSKEKTMSYYGASDQSVIRRFASEENPLLVLAHSKPRRQCEQRYLRDYCRVEEISDSPVVQHERDLGRLTMAERALSFRLEMVLDSDYFVKARVIFADISHGLSVFARADGDKLTVFLDAKGQTVALVLNLYEREYGAFGSMVKDFARSVVFPRISEHVPSSTRQGAEAFLRAVRKPREVFEYKDTDLNSLAKVWKEYTDGLIGFDQAVRQSYATVQSGVQVVDSSSAWDISGVVPDVLRNEQEIRAGGEGEYMTLDPCPSITRMEIGSSAKMLTLSTDEVSLRGYRCFLALTSKVREEIGDFFLQAHRTSIVWGGQRVLYVFLDHSGTYGVYYDLQTNEMLAAESGGGPVPTCTIMLRDNIYIPVPQALNSSFVPVQGQRKRFEVRQDILRVSDL